MKNRTMVFRAVLVFMLLPSFGSPLFSDDFDVVYLGGQSNMEGFGYVNEITDKVPGVIPNVFIFHSSASLDRQPLGGLGTWMPLQPGHGVGFVSDGKNNTYSDRFGVELSLASELQRLRPERKLAIIKYARNGSSIHQAAAGDWGCWEPDFRAVEGPNRDINQYDHFLATIRNATTNSDVDHNGTIDVLNPIGIVWMQGESDAVHSIEIAEQYEANLKRLMDLMRAALRVDDLPVVIGRISDSGKNEKGKIWTHGDVVRAAQASFVDKDSAARLITETDGYGYSDPYHYDSSGYIDLGIQFAKRLQELVDDSSTR